MGRDAVLLIVRHLDLAPSLGLVHRHPHTVGDLVGIKNDETIDITCGTTGSLGEGAVVAEEALLVGVKDGDKRHLRQVEPLTEEVDPDQHVEVSPPKPLHDLHTADRHHLAVEVLRLDPEVGEVLRQLLRQPFRQGGDEHPLIPLNAGIDLIDEVIDLILGRANLYPRVEETRRADQLLDDDAVALLQLIVARRGGDVDHVALHLLKLIEAERTIVDRRREAEAVGDEVLLPLPVAAIHPPHLGDRDVALVDDHQVVLGEVVEEAVGPLARLAPIEVAGVILDTGAVAELLQHGEVIGDPLVESVSLHLFPLLLEEARLLVEVLLDLRHRPVGLLLGGDKEIGRVDKDLVELLDLLAGEGDKGGDPVDLVAPKLDPVGDPLVVLHGGEEVDGVALGAEGAGLKLPLSGGVVDLHQLMKQLVPLDLLTGPDEDLLGGVVLRIGHTVDAGDGGDDDDVAPTGEQLGGGAETELLDLVIDRHILGDVEIVGGEIGLRLVEVVVGDEVLDSVVGEEALKLSVELRRQCLIVRQH